MQPLLKSFLRVLAVNLAIGGSVALVLGGFQFAVNWAIAHDDPAAALGFSILFALIVSTWLSFFAKRIEG